MSEPFVGQIAMFGGNFAPRNWAFCDGQLMQVSQNDALFSLVGTIYGGDGRTTFGLPDLRGRVPIHQGSGPGLTPRPIGQKSGSEQVTLNTNTLPTHSHAFKGSGEIANSPNPQGRVVAKPTTVDLYINEAQGADLAGEATGNAGGSQHHTNVMPFQCVTFIIALYGVYPSRN
jgi:microcystin-dependent protein